MSRVQTGWLLPLLLACHAFPARQTIEDAGPKAVTEARPRMPPVDVWPAEEVPPPDPACWYLPTPCRPGTWCHEVVQEDVAPLLSASGRIGLYTGPTPGTEYYGAAFLLRADNVLLRLDPYWTLYRRYEAPGPILAAAVQSAGGSQDHDTLSVMAGDGFLQEEHCGSFPCRRTAPTLVPGRVRAAAVVNETDWYDPKLVGWAVGDAIYRFENETWTQLYGSNELLTGIAELDQNIFVTGKSHGVILRFDGSVWNEETPIPNAPASARFHSVAEHSRTPGSELIAVGDNGMAVARRSDGWHLLSTGTTEALLEVQGEWVRGEHHVFRIGADALTPAGDIGPDELIVDNPDQRTWWRIPRQRSLDASILWDECDESGCQARAVVPHRTSLKFVVSTRAFGSWAIDGEGLSYRRDDEGRWHPSPSNLYGRPLGLRGSDASGIWAFSWTVVHMDGARWEVLEASRNGYEYTYAFTDVLPGDSPETSVIFGEGCSHGFPEDCTADVAGTASFSLPPNLWSVTAAVPIDGGAMIATAATYRDDPPYRPTFVCSAGVCETPVEGPPNLSSLWAASASEAWAVGHEYGVPNRLWHYQGTEWAPVSVAGVPEAVWGRSSNDVWWVGAAGAIQHWDGSTWSAMESGTQADLHSVSGNADGVFAVGECGTILRLSE